MGQKIGYRQLFADHLLRRQATMDSPEAIQDQEKFSYDRLAIDGQDSARAVSRARG
jgi:hypothetical protein